MPAALIGLGSNLGDRAGNMYAAMQALRRTPGIESLRTSSFHVTPPLGGPAGQPPFLNAAASLNTSLAPLELWAILAAIENDLGRVRATHWGPRTLDLDLLLYHNCLLHSPTLTLPHPRFAFRRFALAPAAEIAPNMILPGLELSITQLLMHWNTAPLYVEFAGPEAGHYAQIAEQHFGARWLHSPLPNGVPPKSQEWLLSAIEAAATTLAKSSWPTEKRLSVSDFCFHEWLANIRGQLPPAEMENWNRRAAQLQAAVVSPRLIVVCGPCSHGPSHLSGQAREPWLRTPTLVLNTLNPAAARGELLAAIEGSL